MDLLQVLLAGALAAVVVWLFRPGIAAALQKSREAKSDWPSVLIPLALVVAFVVLLIMLV